MKNTKNKNSNLTARLIISQEQSWAHGLVGDKWVQCWFFGQNSQIAGQILFSPGVFVGYFQNIYTELGLYLTIQSINGAGMSTKLTTCIRVLVKNHDHNNNKMNNNNNNDYRSSGLEMKVLYGNCQSIMIIHSQCRTINTCTKCDCIPKYY